MSMKFDIEKLDMQVKFCLWLSKMKDVRVQSGCHKALEGASKKSVINRLLLQSRLHDLSLEEGIPLESQLDELFSIIMNLQNIDVEIDDEDITIRLLYFYHL